MAQAPKGIDSSGKEITRQLQESGNRIAELEQIRSNLPAGTTPDQVAQLDDEIRRNKETVNELAASLQNFSSQCTTRNVDIGWMRENIAECKTYLKTEQYAYWAQLVQTDMSGPDPCGDSTIAKISKGLQKFFTFLKSIKKYYDVYVQGTINAIQGLTSKIRSVTDLIAGVLRILIQRVRNYIVQKLRNLLTDALASILPRLAKEIKDGIIKVIIDTLFCKFTDIIKGLVKLVEDFLFSLIGNFINAPFCAAEQFTNSLINNLANRIDKALEPILSQINNILGGISKIAGSVFQAIDFVLGFEKFLCSKGPECPELKEFKASWWGGPSQGAADKFNNFLTGLQLGPGDSNDLLNQFDKWLTGTAFGGELGRGVDPNVASTLECNTDAFRCGPPQVQIFGGGGVGAVGKAVVNTIGQVVGVDLVNRGYGYTSPPFVTFIDNCGNGNYAAGYVRLDEGDTQTPPRDPITGSPIGEGGGSEGNFIPRDDNNDGIDDGGYDRGEEGGCVYDATVFHEFDNDNNVHINTEISSAITVEFKSKDMPDGVPALPALNTNKHYSIKFVVPYEDDRYAIDIYDKAPIAAAIQQRGYQVGQTMEVAAIKNKTRFGFDIWFGRRYTTTVEKVVGSVETTSRKTIPVPAKFVQQDGKFYLDLRGETGEINFRLKYVMRDTRKGGRGLAGRKFIIQGTDIVYDRKDNDENKLVKRGTYSKNYTLQGGKLYGPIIFEGADKGSEVSIPSFTEIRSLDKRSAQKLKNGAKNPDLIDFNVYITQATRNVVTKKLDDKEETVEEEVFVSSYIRYFKFKTSGKRSSCIPGSPINDIVITNPGNGYLPAPDGKDEFGNELTEKPENEPIRDYVGCLTEIQVLSTGIGYSPEDTISISPDIPGLQVKVQLTEQGQIANMLVQSEGCGVTELPDIQINSETGNGAEFRPVIKFTRLEEFNRRPVSQREIIQVIDCV